MFKCIVECIIELKHQTEKLKDGINNESLKNMKLIYFFYIITQNYKLN